MELPVPPPEVAREGLRGIKAVAMADGELHALERRLLDAAQQHILKTNFDVDGLEPIEPDALAAAMPAPFRERVLYAALVCALIDGDASEAEVALLERYATAFGIDSRAIRDARRLVEGQLRLFRIDILRRSFIGQRIRKYLEEHKLRGLWNMPAMLQGKSIPDLAQRYQALEAWPDGTLGREYVRFIRDNGFSLPGEPGGAPEPIVFHDCLHVLGGYGTEPLEETQVASFQAGMMHRDPVFGMFFVLAQFHLGVQISPVAPSYTGVVDPDLMLRAFVRGNKVNRDLCTDWNWWDDFDDDVDAVRAKYDIEPR